MIKTTRWPLQAGAALLVLACSGAAFAGRPLVVDDANTNDAGRGHVETWLSRQDGESVYSVAPAYAFREGMEIGALVARAPSAHVTATALQLKWRITPSRANGCNAGVVGGLAHATGTGNAPYLNGLATCNVEGLGSFHFNLGGLKPRDASFVPTWGLAFEKPISAVVAHLEVFGARDTRPTVQLGLRADVVQGIQLDGSVGRNDGRTLWTVGLKFQF
jgi:hypothetical protein